MDSSPPGVTGRGSARDAWLDDLLDAAFEAFDRGDTAAAVVRFETVLRIAPDDFDALHTLGLIALAGHRWADAARWFERSVAEEDALPGPWANLALARAESGDAAGAVAAWEIAGQRGAERRSVDLGLALCRLQLGQTREALERLDALIARDADDAVALRHRGSTHLALGAFDAAADDLALAARLEPDDPVVRSRWGQALLRAGRLEPAVDQLERAATLAPHDVDVQCLLGEALLGLDRPMAARQVLFAASRAAPGRADLLTNLAAACTRLARHTEAVAALRQAVEAAPTDGGTPAVAAAELRTRLAAALRRGGDAQAAEAEARHAIDLGPSGVPARVVLGDALIDQGRPAEALAAYDAAREARPCDAEAAMAAAQTRLLLGEWSRGLPDFDTARERLMPIPFASTLPRLASLAQAEGRGVLLRAVDGLGDTLMFARYAPWLQAAGARVLLQVQAPLAALLARAWPGLTVIALDDPWPQPVDAWLPLMALPALFGSAPESVPAAPSGLGADGPWRERAATMLGPSCGLRVGIAWSGSPGNPNDAARSMPLAAMLDGLGSRLPPGTTLYRLQASLPTRDLATLAGAVPPVHSLDALLAGFDASAALVEAMDAVVTVDTSIAHLAGTLGRPTALLLSVRCDWRWLVARADTPWYPSLRLMRQRRSGDWSAPLDEAVAWLHRLAAARA